MKNTSSKNKKTKVNETTVSNVNGFGEVVLPNADQIGSGDVSVNLRTFDQVLKDRENKDDEEENSEFTEEQYEALKEFLLGNTLNEALLGSILGGITGFALGKRVGKIIADVLGLKEKSTLYNLLTSRLVATAIGVALGKKLRI